MRWGGRAALALWCAAVSQPAAAVIPEPHKVVAAVAEVNLASRRAEPLWLEVNLRFGEAEAVGTGVLVSHPTGLARLELQGPGGLVERHLLQGSEYAASRDGKFLDRPRPFLPPLFVLQATSDVTLGAALVTLGVDPGQVALGSIEEHDCYVLGGRVLPPLAEGQTPARNSLWVDAESFDVLRMTLGGDVRFEFGPHAVFDGIRLPRWIAVEIPGQETARLEVLRVAPATAPVAAFRKSWLEQP